MLDFLSLMIALVGLIVARKAFNQAAVLRARLETIETTALQPGSGPPPLPPREELKPAPSAGAGAPGIASEPPAEIAEPEPAAAQLPIPAPPTNCKRWERWTSSTDPPRSIHSEPGN